MYTTEELNSKLLSELREIGEELGVRNSKKLAKAELVQAIARAARAAAKIGRAHV